MFDATVKEALNTELNPADVAKRPDGMSYLSGHYVFSKANEIFGIDGWTYEVLDITPLPNGVIHARVKVTIGDVSRIDVGTGVANPDRTQSYETAIKDSVTDGVKRTLRGFGLAFGLSLYDKESGLHAQAAPLPNQNKRSTMSRGNATEPQSGNVSLQSTEARWPAGVPEEMIPEEPVCEVSGEPFTGYTSSTGRVYTPRVEAAWAFKEYGRIVKKRYANQ